MTNMKKRVSSSSTDDSMPELVKQCRVCGDKASAFNFNGLSCESCKSFFRRNAGREKELDCIKDGTCEITIKTRKFCGKCRLARCFTIGMRKELIYKRRQCQSDEVSFIRSEILNAFNTVPTNIRSTPVIEQQFPGLTNLEKARIEEISGYYKEFGEESSVKTITDPPAREIWLDHGEEYVKHVVKIIKNMPIVEQYSMDDRIAMVRNFVMIFFNLRYMFTFDVEGDYGLVLEMHEKKFCYKMPANMWDDFITDDMKQAWKDTVLVNKSVFLNDTVIRDILITMSLFWEAKVSCPEMLRLHYLEYYYLLKRYLQVKLKTRDRYEKHMQRFHKVLIGFKDVMNFSRQFYLHIQPHYSSQLMAEIYED